MEIGKLEKVPLREIWKHEEKDFTKWLADNLEVLSDKLGISLSLVQTEKECGTFSADLLAEDANGQNVIIECQLERTDHDHLGKLITYLTVQEARTAIWICKEPHPEHIEAIDWLNTSTREDIAFYLVKVEAMKIKDSPPAPLFQVICSPSVETKEKGKKKEELASRHIKRLEFWRQLLEKNRRLTHLHSNVSPSKENWISAGAGKAGMTYNYVINMDSARVELYIDRGKDSEEINRKRFEALYAQKDVIENAFGGKLEWTSVVGRRSRTIGTTVSEIGLSEEGKWSEIQDQMISAMTRLEKALKPHIARLE